ncbi:hypothetical protein EYR38_007045 [Pleurotus pulmonarius]|nr:hypothetical protein EYR38_007045 [Pleurotus pulmonarius]
MATTLVSDQSRGIAGPSGAYSQALMSDLDFRDDRYPSLATPSIRRTSAMLLGSTEPAEWESQKPPSIRNGDIQRRPSRVSQLRKEYGEQPVGPRERNVEQESGDGRPTTGDAAGSTVVQGQSDTRPQSPQSLNQSLPPSSPPMLFQSRNLFRNTSSASGAAPTADIQSLRSLGTVSQQSQTLPQGTSRTEIANSYGLPPGAGMPEIERTQSRGLEGYRSGSPAQMLEATPSSQSQPRNGSMAPRLSVSDRPSLQPSSPRHPSLTLAAGANSNANGGSPSPFLPLSASPAYSPPISPNMRAYAQQPTYVSAPNAGNTTYRPSSSPQATLQPTLQPIQPQRVPVQEEVCVECAMRDQDMADVDVTSPGVWERESDVHYRDLLRRELEEDVHGVSNGSSRGSIEDNSAPPRPRARGGRLTEQNLKLWLTMNPREPASRQQTLTTYVTAQRSLLEAEAIAHARAMQESKQLDNRMRDTYSQLRRSAYDTGSAALPGDDAGGVRIKPPVSVIPTSPYSPAAYAHNNPTYTHDVHGRSQSREITLLENGMIMEHVDVRKEEREARERRRKEEKRARKGSRSSGMDVMSLYSVTSYPQSPLPDSATFGQHRPYSRYSEMTGSSIGRPTSVLTAPLDGVPGSPRPDIPRAYSQASFSDAHSMSATSSRRPRFLGFKNLAGWRSQDSLAPSGMSIMSGSVVNMHVALAREDQRHPYAPSPIDLNTPTRRSHIWPTTEADPSLQPMLDEKPKKKKTGLAKIWRIVTGSNKHDSSRSRGVLPTDRQDDDTPLAPPPPLSYLVDRAPGDAVAVGSGTGSKQTSTPSLQSSTSPRMMGIPSSPGMSPSTAPSSILPSPVSSRRSGHDMLDSSDPRKISGGFEEPMQQFPVDQRGDEIGVDGSMRTIMSRNVHSVISEPDIRGRMSQNMGDTPSSRPPLPSIPASRPASVISRDKSLPPLPGEPRIRSDTMNGDIRPRSVFSLNYRPPGTAPAHDFLPPQAPFRTADVRRQSFGGTASHPNLVLQTMPVQGQALRGYPSFGPHYDEFGTSRRSLGPMESPTSLATPKRKSKFGFSSLLGKRHTAPEKVFDEPQQFPSMGASNSDIHVDMVSNSSPSVASKFNPIQGSGARISMMSRKAIDELVDQDRDFVAYRYPSSEQRIDLLR